MGKVIIVPWLPWGYGFTFWKLIVVSKQATDLRYVIEHERVHVEQWINKGFFKFMYCYLRELYNVGYYDNVYEIEARVKGAVRAKRKRNMPI